MYHLYIEDDLQQYTAEQIENLIATLPPQRREVVMRFKFEQGRKESTLAYLLLCKGLTEHYGVKVMPDFVVSEHGKPSLADYPDIHFNLSHCKEAVACVIADFPVGVDVERLRPQNEEVIRYTMNEKERDEISRSADPTLTFTCLWTQKEAVFKLRGTGITDDIKNILNDTSDIRIDTTVHEEKRYVCSVARLAEN
ncbi:MAG: 4'-phosphopantetheinyl transferase superfamily protein [Bacteroidaceae bacterium]|nr:4'-phosphopantetheinyl transferase superfamily protein [Bacteroidaceae bacterium]